jgi:epoxyqueuosine reductase QueG
LGTFGLCDGLITRVGKAHRMGSLVINHPLPVTLRDYRDDDFRRDCLWFNSGSCGLCVKRCPVGALSSSGHDKEKCSGFLNRTKDYIAANWPDLAGAYGCGLCQSRVPCAVRAPKLPKAGSVAGG